MLKKFQKAQYRRVQLCRKPILYIRHELKKCASGLGKIVHETSAAKTKMEII